MTEHDDAQTHRIQEEISRSLTPQPASKPEKPLSAEDEKVLSDAEDDREIVRCLVQRVIDNLEWEFEDEEMLQEKQEALKRASRRLEDATAELEKQQKRVGLSVNERLRRLELYEQDISQISTVLRRLKTKLNRGEQKPERSQDPKISTAIGLPKMELKTFDGNALRWHEFWECFEHGVHKPTNLPAHQKLQYLTSSLRGAAFVTVSELDMRGDNYEVAVKLLQERYSHKNVLRKAHLGGLEKVAPELGSYEIQKMKRLYEEVESHYKALLAIDVKPEGYEATMVPKLINKIPVQVRIKLTEEKDENEDLNMDEVVSGLRKTVKVMEKCGVQPRDHQQQEIRRSRDRRPTSIDVSWTKRNNVPSGATLIAADAKKKPRCDFCLEPHQSTQCKKFPEVGERKDVLRKFKRCFKCLKKGHYGEVLPKLRREVQDVYSWQSP